MLSVMMAILMMVMVVLVLAWYKNSINVFLMLLSICPLVGMRDYLTCRSLAHKKLMTRIKGFLP